MRLSRLNLVVDMNKNPFASIVNLFTFSVCLAGMAALLLPTIVNRRHASRASACSNNLRQIGLGFHNYHSAYKQLPWATGGTTGNSAPELSNGGRLGPFVGLLPFLEQQQLWEMISNPYVNSNTGQAFPPMGPVPWYAPTKYEPWGMSPEIYHCPADGPAQDLSSAPKTVYSLARRSAARRPATTLRVMEMGRSCRPSRTPQRRSLSADGERPTEAFLNLENGPNSATPWTGFPTRSSFPRSLRVEFADRAPVK